MMRGFPMGTAILMGALLGAGAPSVSAQLTADIQVSWQWSDDGWDPDPVVDGYIAWRDAPRRRYESRPARVRPAPRARVRIPPGHMPPPGLCRAWIVGRPPGHQPPSRTCARVFRNHHGPDVVIVHTPVRDERRWRDEAPRGGDRWEDDWDDWDGDDWDDEDWDDDDWDDRWENPEKRWKDRGKGRKGGRGHPGRGRGGWPR